MRHLRRASGNHKGHGGPTDLQIREQLTQPSVQSFLAQARLRYAAGIAKRMPKMLCAVVAMARRATLAAGPHG